MCETSQENCMDLTNMDVVKNYENLISYLRSRLNVINTSVYLLEASWKEGMGDPTKYFKKINEEMESIRKLINI